MLKVALIQMLSTSLKNDNLQKAARMVQKAANMGAKLVCLPECFNSPYGVQYFKEYAEPIPGNTFNHLASMAKENAVYLIGGSFPEINNQTGKIYNTTTVFSPSGDLIGRYSKLHLFDIDVPGKMTFKESEVLTAGNDLLSFSVPTDAAQTDAIIKVGIGICYDVRFTELAQIYARQHGCALVVYPGSFNMTTGPAHLALLTRALALNNQCYVAFCSGARDESASYVAYGHSTLVGPWGGGEHTLDEKEGILVSDVDLQEINRVRSSIPISNQRRLDLYKLAEKIDA